jgi:hypothetical protein
MLSAAMLADVLRLGLALLVLPVPLAAQELDEIPADTFRMIIPPPTLAGHAVARYADDGRRDPFVPLVGRNAASVGGPRFELLRLTGVFMGSPGNSLVVLEDPANRGHFVRVGEEVGNATLVEILADAAVFEVRDYGADRRQVLSLDPDARPAARVQPTPEPAVAPPPAPVPPAEVPLGGSP